MHIDGQTIAAFAIVGVAAVIVGKRILGQLLAFRSTPGQSGEGCPGCGGCGNAGKIKQEDRKPQLIQLQTRPPAHLRRPPSQS
ncbi:hypothetical protein CCAX7_52880 [Capsulimonas corticalis]|uniref:Uncharacterized protein n=1 Tax=Capsulimonas corticalis TaxID=2219043 RepID=A0A402CNT5_9BACT|nr:hypothetical protein [Capsulimonas corticalis]BDI33237.1 hypothetical protein CCAX7_52880 [Capsulimonas corticalis]